MSSKIFKTLLETKIKEFVYSFSNEADSLFYSEEKLFHPAEYGRYRERLAKNLLKPILKGRFEIEDGFVITSNEDVSTQCDLIIFDFENTPIVRNETARFFPVENVVGIGEIKSNLSKQEFIKALNKLAKIKSLRDHSNGLVLSSKTSAKYDTKTNVTDQMFSFLICNDLNFDITKIPLSQLYDKGVEDRNKHNVILIIQKGILVYTIDYRKNSSLEHQEKLKQQGRNLNLLVQSEYPIFQGKPIQDHFILADKTDKYSHIFQFIFTIERCANFCTLLEPDLIAYIRNYR